MEKIDVNLVDKYADVVFNEMGKESEMESFVTNTITKTMAVALVKAACECGELSLIAVHDISAMVLSDITDANN